MKQIWMYWENEKPEYINLCIKSIEKRKGNLKLHLLTPTSIREFIPNLRPEWHKLKPAHKADYIRTRLVHQYGGMWIDCDMLALQDIEPLFDFPEQYDYACRDIVDSIGCFIARPNCKILENIIAEQDRLLDTRAQNIIWSDIGNGLLKKFGPSYPHFKWKESTVDSIEGGKVSILLSRNEKIADHVHPNAVLFHLCNENFGPLIKTYLRDGRCLTSNMLISKIFRKAFDIEENNASYFEWFESIKDYNFSHSFKKILAKLAQK